MLKKLNKSNKGFTIIEVLIVLAIAALILLIVFLAVPALQRNSRNTSIKNDAANILGGMSNSVSNNNGVLPTNVTCAADGTVTIANTAPSDIKVRSGTTCTFTAGAPGAPGATGIVAVGTNAGCNAAGNASVAKNRGLAAVYLVETGASTTAPNCAES